MLSKLLESKAFKLIKDFRELWGTLAFLIPFFTTPLAPDLIAISDKSILLFPIIEQNKEPVSERGAPSLLTIRLVNRSSDVIQSIDLVINGLEEVISTAVTSSSPRVVKEATGAARIERIARSSFHFPSIPNIPPRQTVTIQIAGHFDGQFWFQSPIELTSSAKSTRVFIATPTYGVFAFVYQNTEILVVTFLVFLVGIGLWRASKNNHVY